MLRAVAALGAPVVVYVGLAESAQNAPPRLDRVKA
jgi:hypothetical protein